MQKLDYPIFKPKSFTNLAYNKPFLISIGAETVMYVKEYIYIVVITIIKRSLYNLVQKCTI